MSTNENIIIKAGETRELLLNEAGDHTFHFIQEEGSSLRINALILPSTDCRIDITIEQNAQHCNTELYGLVIASGEQKAEIQTHVLHNIGGGKSNQLFKYILADKAQGNFFGELKVLPNAQKTEAYQLNRNLLLSSAAKMQTKPQLEIYADDVKCSHGASTGQLDTSALFYMQQRCIDPIRGKQLLIMAFCHDVINNISDEKLRDKLIDSVDSVIEHL